MNIKTKFRGSLLGNGIGDALGRSREGGEIINREKISRIAEDRDILRYTDDTQQMIGLAEMLSEKGEFDREYFGERLVENFNPSRGYGPGSSQVIRSIERGDKWDEPAQGLFGGEGSYGNGSSMRAAPAGLFCFDDLDNLRSFAGECSRITHVHRLGVEGAILQSCSVALAVNEDPSSGFDGLDFLSDVREFIEEKEYLEKVDMMEDLLEDDPEKREVIRRLGNGVEAFNSVPTALYSFLANSESFEDAVTFGISLGGDADTIGAMTGAIAGAYHGAENIPSIFKEKLEDSDYILELADKLFEVKK